MKSLRSLLKEDRLVVGFTMQHITRPWLVELYAQAGSDFVYIEYEHCFLMKPTWRILCWCAE